MTLLGKQTKSQLAACPVQGGGPMMQDAVGGHVPLVIGSVFVVKPHRQRPRAARSGDNVTQLPNCPAFRRSPKSAICNGQFEARRRGGPMMLAPATPPEIITRMNAEIGKGTAKPDTAKAQAQGINLIGGSPETTRIYRKADRYLGAKVVKRLRHQSRLTLPVA